jgi:flagellar protein FliS
MPVLDAARSYRQISTLTAPPGQVVLMLFEGAIRYLEQALAGFAHQDPAQRNMTVNNNLQRARNIIQALDVALDLEKGGELAATLGRLYEYFDRRLHEANVKKTRHGVEEVIRHLTELRDAWSAMLTNHNSAMVPAPESSLAFAQA